ncbi:hypothetical protein CORC01_05083 [Colletotrichum orchidophilum]|uniref:Microtubule associated protein n=1 Tax=Colletotrichum orchidophilum TaxID=1209926 RepID=A0A1G4BEG0_9PEZI|nr:uncharacterized protein CORC01_05083 [Colletotrichum orchidophilum]OHE99725.1 hypothetical protein CORC01_05083 [Colletotrichum orchidophilum]
MAQPTRPPANGFVATTRKVYNPLGFSKGYNFVLFFIFFGALMGFTLARFEYLNFNTFCKGTAPGECFYYQKGHEKAGIILHLAGILPAGFLACFQFVPVLRHKVLLFHRINGYVVILLALVGIAGALMIARNAFGGTLDTQAGVGVMSIMFVTALTLAFVNIKRLQIEQHRAWMLRAWFYAGSIITLRLIQVAAAAAISSIGTYYAARPCDQVAFMIGKMSRTLHLYPDCATYFSGENSGQQTIVHADFLNPTSAAEAAVAVGMPFGMALWLALALHAVGIEIYLKLTPAEAERLRNVSYKRQLEAGLSPAGRAGVTADRIGDSEQWQPQQKPSQASSTSDLPTPK